MISPDNTEEYPLSKESRNDAWIIEAIWGHRIERQPFSALLLEFLGMAEGLFRAGNLFGFTTPSSNPLYVANQCLQLRNILFNNPKIEEIRRNSRDNDELAWREWLEWMKRDAVMGRNASPDFEYLRERFESFEDFANVVQLLRNIKLDESSERGWTTQFIFPIGPAALYEALLVRESGDFERTRRVFTRTGEIAYLMLSRASDPLRSRLRAGLAPSFRSDGARNQLLMTLISTPEPDRGASKGGTYLPYKQHPAYDRLAEDVAAILELGLPDQDAFQYLPNILALHIYLYGLETGNHWLGGNSLPPIVCEILAPRSDLVRKAAIASFLDNDALGIQAVHAYIDKRILSDEELNAKLASTELDEAAKKDCFLEHLIRTCALKKTEVVSEAQDLSSAVRRFRSFAEKYYKCFAADGFGGLARACGLVSKRSTTRYRYAPTDTLLRALVLANVTEPVEEGVFLRTLYDRYHIVIGPAEAKDAVPETHFDDTDFRRNRERFTRRLVGMGLAQRMSDACTYVRNPMGDS